MVGQYFDKRKGMAMSLGTIGAGLGAAVFGPSITFMMHNFGYMGCMLILAAVEFHCCIAGSLLRPFVERSSPVVEMEIQVVASKSDINKVDDNKLANAKQDEKNKTHRHSAITSYIKLFSSATRIFYFASITSLPMAFGVVIYFMPDAAMLSGYTDTEGAWLLSVFGICDVIGRLFWGFMFDLKVLRRRRSISFALLGWSCVVWSCLLSNMYINGLACRFGDRSSGRLHVDSSRVLALYLLRRYFRFFLWRFPLPAHDHHLRVRPNKFALQRCRLQRLLPGSRKPFNFTHWW